MSGKTIKERLEHVERELESLKKQITGVTPARKKKWWNEIAGSFENDPIFAEAMRLGREYRESLRPKAPKKKSRKRPNGRSGH
jgi:hypothetical protein